MVETIALSAEFGAELVGITDVGGLLDEVLAWATQSRFCYAHDWSVHPSSDRMLPRTHIKGQEAWT